MAAPEYQRALDFVERGENATSLEGLEELFAQALADFGVTSFTVIAMLPQPPSPARVPTVLLARNNLEWELSYRERKLYNIDPTVHAAFRTADAFSWTDIESPRLPKPVRHMFEETREAMSVEGGLLVPSHDAEGCAGLVALYHQDRELPKSWRTALKLMSQYALDRAKALGGQPAPVNPENRERLKSCPLTVRQREVLSYVADGKSDWIIGEILSIAESTVNEHIEKAKANLGVRTRAQAVAQAVRFGWIQI